MAVTERSDAELLGRVREGDETALGELYLRHRPAALRLARSYGNRADAEDLVNGAFERVLAALRRGHGPAEAFRPYLFVTVRRLAGDRAAASGDDATLDEVPESVAAADDPSVIDLTDRRLVAEAFAALPDRWQTVLWHTAIEGRRPREVARATGLPANTVSVLAHRARERLRQTYLQAHVSDACPPACAATRQRMGSYVRGAVARRSRSTVEAHLDGCADCRAIAAELRDVNRLLARAVAPLFAIGGGAEAAVGAATSGGVSAGAAGAGAGALAGGTATGEGTATLGGTVASGGAAGAAGAGIGAATLAKIGAAVVAVVGLVAVSPVDLPRVGGDDRDGRAVTAGDAGGSLDEGSSTTTAPAPTAGAPEPTTVPGPPTDAAAPDTGADAPVLDVDAQVDLGDASVDAGVRVAPAPGVAVDAQVGADVADGVDLRAAWRAGVLGTGQLVLEVLNPGPAPLVGGELVVDLSSGAHATSLLGGACRATEGGLVGIVVVDLLRSLTCGLAEVGATDDATLELPLSVLGAGQTASVRLVAGGVELASTVVVLSP